MFKKNMIKRRLILDLSDEETLELCDALDCHYSRVPLSNLAQRLMNKIAKALNNSVKERLAVDLVSPHEPIRKLAESLSESIKRQLVNKRQ